MAYDLIVSKDLKRDKNPKHLGELSYEDYPALQELANRTKYNFLQRLLDPYKDETFGAQDLNQAQAQLHELITAELDTHQQALTYKLLAIIGFALSKSENLYGVAD